ncbi:hypothetical protein [uncultured Nocardioides sp.]|jgi:hypothetical protein|uniref:hypothetical protein n=1 Tax=uncultured Nocardioides sp. TaxID=198441 RepID=UPI0023B61CBD
MTWWQILLVFVGIPAAIFLLITVAVFRFATARVPDGLLRAEQQQDENGPSPEEHEDTSEDAEDV